MALVANKVHVVNKLRVQKRLTKERQALTPHLRVRAVYTPRLKEFVSNTLFVGNLRCVNKNKRRQRQNLEQNQRSNKKNPEQTGKWSIQFLLKVVTQSNLNKKPRTPRYSVFAV